MAYQYFTGIETGDLGEWNTTVGSATIVTAPVKSGGYAMKLSSSNDNNYILYTGLASAATYYGRAYINAHVTTPPGSLSERPLFSFCDAAITFAFGVYIDFNTNGTLALVCDNHLVSPVVISSDTWHLIEINVVISPTVGVLEWKLNGTVIETQTSKNTGSTNITSVRSRCQVDAGTGYVIFDDIMVSDSAYPGPGKCIARQGLAGTPTYDSFTKVVGATAQECWSETPYSATKACTSITSGGAQTMLAAPLGLSGNETINAIKVGMVGKVAIATSHSIRRRFAGADTDTSKSITTADAYYETAPFTDTIANLNSSEIGVLHGANTNLLTIEDMWTMVDYSVPGHTYVPNKLRPYPFAPGVAR